MLAKRELFTIRGGSPLYNLAKHKHPKLRNIPKDPATRLAWWNEKIEQLKIRLEHAKAQRELALKALMENQK